MSPYIDDITPFVPWQNARAVFAGGTITSKPTKNGRTEGPIEKLIRLVNLFAGEIGEQHEDYELYENLARLLASNNAAFVYGGLSENINQKVLDQITNSIRQALNHNPELVLVTCGTDAMEEVAFYVEEKLGSLIREKNAKVIFTGANRDLYDPSTDGGDNIVFAYGEGAKDIPSGTYIGFHDRLIPARKAVKQPFISNAPYKDTEMKYIEDGSQEYLERKYITTMETLDYIDKLDERAGLVTEVNSSVVEHAVNRILPNHNELYEKIDPNTKAVLLTLRHGGTANADPNNPDANVAKLVSHLRDKGIICFGVTENGEPTDLRAYETSSAIRKAGCVPLYNIKKGVALRKLRHAVQICESKHSLIDYMLTNKVGELDEEQINHDDIKQLKTLHT